MAEIVEKISPTKTKTNTLILIMKIQLTHLHFYTNFVDLFGTKKFATTLSLVTQAMCRRYILKG